MYQYINEVLDKALDIYNGSTGCATSAQSNFCNIRSVDDGSVNALPDKEKNEYHTLTTQCLYLLKRVRPDLQISIVSHYTQVKSLMKMTIRNWVK